MKISVIVPVFNHQKKLINCIESILNNTMLPDEMIFVDNGSIPPIDLSDYSLFKNIILLTEKKVGSYAARNKGIKYATGNIIGFTDSDCIVDKYWVENAYRIIINNPGIGFIAGTIHVFPQFEEHPNLIEQYEMIFAFNQYKCHKNANFSHTANMWTTMNMFKLNGLFDESLLSSGDYVWCNSVIKAGYPSIYSENVQIYHPARSTFSELKSRNIRVGAGYFDRSTAIKEFISNFLRLLNIGKNRIKAIFKNKNMKLMVKAKITIIILYERFYNIVGFLSRLILSRQYR